MTGTEAIALFNSRYEFMASENAPGFMDDEILELLNDSQYKFISQRAFGNNLYKTGLEESVKRIDDLEKLITDETISTIIDTGYDNVMKASLPSTYLHHVVSHVELDSNYLFNTELISQLAARPLIKTPVNNPWIEEPFIYIKDGSVWVVYDTTSYSEVSSVLISFIKDPDKITTSDITWFSESSVREIVRIAVDEAYADAVPSKVQISNDQLNKSE